MRIRSHQIYTIDDLYQEYLKAYQREEIFDAFTLSVSVYIDASRLLSLEEFRSSCHRTKVNRYGNCDSYSLYKSLQREHINAVLPNNVVLTIFTDYNKNEFKTVLDGGFVLPQPKEKIKGMTAEIYNSNKIEGIDVSLLDTQTILAGGKTVNVKYDDELSVLNAKDAYDLRKTMEGFVTEPYLICRLHYELMKGLREDAGRFRTYQVFIGSASHDFPDFKHVPHRISKLDSFSSEDVLMSASLIHANFINIHPFGDGNGRIGRLITHPFTNIPFEDRLEYYAALDAYGKYQSVYPLYSLVCALNNY